MTFTFLVTILAALNKSIDTFLLGLLLLGIVIGNFRSLVISINKNIEKEAKQVEQEEKDRIKENGGDEKSIKPGWGMGNPNAWIAGIGKTVYIWVMSISLQFIVLLLFWHTRDIHINWPKPDTIVIPADILRWAELYALLSSYIYFTTRKFGDRRGLNSILGHLTILLLGWLFGRWFGILFVSLPMLAIYYHVIYRFAEIIIPASNPDDRDEKWQRFKILVWYMWGMQFPIIIVDDPANPKCDVRIKGDVFQTPTGMPGYIWTHMPQAIGLTGGTNFSRVEGPGAIYTKRFERPLDVIDLRTQLRTTEIEAITQDGIPIKAIVFASFRVDNSSWQGRYIRLTKANPLLQGGLTLDHGNSHFQYSRARVRAVLSMEGVQTSLVGQVGAVSWRWDEQVMNMVAERARRVISEIPLSELWQPNAEKDKKGVSALDLIADKIKDEKNIYGLFSILQKNGVLLYAARVVNYFSLDDKPENKFGEFTHQQIPVWQARWEQQVEQKLAEADADAEQKQMDATALARSMLLTSVAESLQKATTNNKDLPRYLIAMRFLGTLDEMIRKEPELAAGEKGKMLRDRINMINSLHLPKS